MEEQGFKRGQRRPLGTGYKLESFKLDWTEFENQSDQLVIGWDLDAEMRKGDLIEVSWIQENTSCFYISVNPLCIIHIRPNIVLFLCQALFQVFPSTSSLKPHNHLGEWVLSLLPFYR